MFNFIFKKKSNKDAKPVQNAAIENDKPDLVKKSEEDIFASAAKIEDNTESAGNLVIADTVLPSESSIEVPSELPEQLPQKSEVIDSTIKQETAPLIKQEAAPQVTEMEIPKSVAIEDKEIIEASKTNDIEPEVKIVNNEDRYTHPNNQDPSIWVPQLIEILREMAKEPVSPIK
jgi:hypothetical protein